MADFEIIFLNESGEIAVRALTSRAQVESGMPIGHMIVFKSRGDASQYVDKLKNRGFCFLGGECFSHQ